ncbi:GTPase HflX [Candidatus Peregrinibacteria bacterium]|nr:GTPase HflX [Candidatus Peregrinibacteria bacterium]
MKAILVDIITPDTSKEDAENRMLELESLVNTYGGIVVIKAFQKRQMPDYDTYVGKGKIEEIVLIGKEKHADIIIINNLLKPKQIFNLEEIVMRAHGEAAGRARRERVSRDRSLQTNRAQRGEESGSASSETKRAYQQREDNMKVWDRIDLILKIFDKHAKTSEAKLQIELAGIRHMGPRIFGMGLELSLSQQKGSIGVRGGQGESNIEIMKRHLRRQEQNILKKLEHYELINRGHRQRRQRHNFKTAAIVGYTNAGKSALLNALTKKGAYVADQLFATLSTRVGKLYIKQSEGLLANTMSEQSERIPYPTGKEILISDTIGFIRDLPPQLIKAFKSTLAETIDSDLILHVIDVTDPNINKKIEVVEEILDQLGIHDKPKIYVFNKIDLMKEYSAEQRIKEHNQTKGILEAGISAASTLGWTSEEEAARKKYKKPAEPLKKLLKQCKKFTPVFISAEKKINLNELIEKIKLYL